jgi:hypothetical protein
MDGSTEAKVKRMTRRAAIRTGALGQGRDGEHLKVSLKNSTQSTPLSPGC